MSHLSPCVAFLIPPCLLPAASSPASRVRPLATPLPRRASPCTPYSRSSTSITTVASADPPAPHPKLSPEAIALFKRQVATPIFDPSLAPPPLVSCITTLQAASPPEFLNSAHLPPALSVPASRIEAADHIADRVDALVADARRHVLREFPGIDQPGGALYPSFRADACWRDLTAFLRVAGYKLITDADYSHSGLRVLHDVYVELRVPTDAVAVALAALADAAAADGLSEPAALEVARALQPLQQAVAHMHVPTS